MLRLFADPNTYKDSVEVLCVTIFYADRNQCVPCLGLRPQSTSYNGVHFKIVVVIDALRSATVPALAL